MGFFHLLAIANNAAKSVGIQISFGDPAFNSYERIVSGELLDHMEILFSVFWRHMTPLSREAASFYIPADAARGFQFLHVLTYTYILCFHIV